MFGKNGQSPKTTSTPKPNSLDVCNIALGTNIKGNFKAESNIRLEGSIHGTVSCSGRIVMSKSAYIEGDIICQNIVTEGKVKGNIVAKNKIHLQGTAVIEGNLKYSSLQIEEGAIFNGQSIAVQNNAHSNKLGASEKGA